MPNQRGPWIPPGYAHYAKLVADKLPTQQLRGLVYLLAGDITGQFRKALQAELDTRTTTCVKCGNKAALSSANLCPTCNTGRPK